MAIKSKGRSKSKQVARAPRRDPVEVPTPFFRRRWVQFVGVFLVGMFVFMMGVWVTNGLRSTDRTDAANQTKAAQKTAMITWQNALEPTISTVGQLNGPVPPTIAPTVTAAAANLAKGRPAGASAADLLRSAAALKTAAATIEKVDLVDTIRGKGFDLQQTEALLSSQVSMVAGLRGLEQAARLSVLAIDAEGATKDQLAASAKALAQSSTTLIQDGYNSYLNALNDVGPRRRRPGPGRSSQLIPGG